MPAKIKLEIEGTAWEILEAFKAFVGMPEEITALKLEEPNREPEEWAGPEVIVDAELLDKMEAETKVLRKKVYLPFDKKPAYCAHCGKVLTVKQIDRGGKYCSHKCSAIASTNKRNATREKKKALGLNCKECGKDLTKVQKKFCSRKCSNSFHMKLRKGVTVTKWKPSVTLTAGQGITKGTALTA